MGLVGRGGLLCRLRGIVESKARELYEWSSRVVQECAEDGV